MVEATVDNSATSGVFCAMQEFFAVICACRKDFAFSALYLKTSMGF
jgi:hypothetical protein